MHLYPRLFQAATAATLLALATLPAQAQNINFEDIAVAPGVNNIGGDRTSTGYLFDSSTNHTHLANNTFGAANNSTYLVSDDFQGANTLSMSKVGGGSFSLQQLDIAEWVNINETARTVNVTGFLFGGGTLNQTITLNLVFDGTGPLNDFQTEAFVGWNNLTSVQFQGAGSVTGTDYYALDNIQVGAGVAAIPEFGTVASLGGLLGLGALGVVRSRRKA